MNDVIEQFKTRIKTLETNANKAKEERIRLETNLEQAQKNKEIAKTKIEEKGLTVETIGNVIEEKTKQLGEVIVKLEQALPNKDVVF